MSLTVQTHTYNGAPLYPLQLPLGYIEKAHIYVYDGDESSYQTQLNYTWADDNTIQLEAPFPALGTVFTIRRVVPRADLIAYFEGTRLRSSALDNVNLQQLMIAQELSDGFGGDEGEGGLPLRGVLDMNDNRIINLGAPTGDNDAVRLIDITGGVLRPRGIQFQNDNTYVQIGTALPTPVADGDVCLMTLDCQLHDTALPKTLLVATDGSLCGLNADNTVFYMIDGNGALQQVTLTGFAIPSATQTVITVETRLNVAVLEIRFTHDANSTAWLPWVSTMDWARFFGGVSMGTGVGLTVYSKSYHYAGLVNDWDYSNQQGRTIVSTLALYLGTIYGDSWEAVEDEQVSLPIVVDAEGVDFKPFGTSYPEDVLDVDKVLRNIDQEFLRKGSIDPNPDLGDGVPLAAFRTWLVDTTTSARTRPLPVAPTDGDWVIIRDDKGGIVEGDNAVRPITVGRNGNTIMGLTEDLVFNTNWSWAKVQWFESLSDWRVVEGGVGGQVRYVPLDVAERVYPIGHVLFSMNANNPSSYLQFGEWRRAAVGLFITGAGEATDANNIPKSMALRENTGEWEHTQTEEEMFPHGHLVTVNNNSSRTSGLGSSSSQDDGKEDIETGSRGGGLPMNVTSPSFGMFVWERIA